MSRLDVFSAFPLGARKVLVSIAVWALLAFSSGCSEECYYDTDCPGAHVCKENRCASVDTSVLRAGLCASHLDCAPREECEDGKCVLPEVEEPVEVCETDEDCDPPDTICDAQGDCVPGCSQGDCKEGSYCGPGGRCIEGCASDEHCSPPGTVCDEELGECVDGCTEGDCGVEEHCSDVTGRCEEGCLTDSHCDPPELICEDEECVEGCFETGCPTGMRCDTVSGRCGEGCDSDSDCAPPETICGPGETCVPGCLETGCGFEEHCDDSTGRCEDGCLSDAHCDPPDHICVGEACVPGCLVTGCEFEEHCDEATGRCAPGCLLDEHCAPPATVCEQDSCVPGCIETGCGFEEHCDEATGRCASGCLVDSDCDPPASLCDSQGACVDGCLTTGCGYEEHCDVATGYCEPGCLEHTDCDPPTTVCGDEGDCIDGCMVADFCPEGLLCNPWDGVCEQPGDKSLGANCFDHSECESDLCITICAKACSSSMEHCPTSGHVCVDDYLSVPGARYCADYGYPDQPPGSACSEHYQCKSGQCRSGECTDTCQHDRDCAIAGHVCRLATNDDGDTLLLCAEPTSGSGENGDACSADDDCLRGICVAGVCADPCHSSWDCPEPNPAQGELGMACEPLFPSDHDIAVGARVCREDGAGRIPGDRDVGEPCSQHRDCRSVWCFTAADGVDRCLGFCGDPEACPTGYRCAIMVVTRGEEEAGAPMCMLR